MLGIANGGGAGIVGLGGDHHGTGVRGIGGGGWRRGEGFSGIGVEAVGGEASHQTIGGAGLVARGGAGSEFSGYERHDARLFHPNPARLPAGAGIVAAAGGRAEPMKPDDFGNVGIVGQGGDARHDTRKDDRTEQIEVFGPQAPGAGVMGLGGTTWTNNGDYTQRPTSLDYDGGPGVVGVAGGELEPPSHALAHGIGVIGISGYRYGVFGRSSESAGLFGDSDKGNGVVASSNKGRGAVFSSNIMPQLQLLPIIDNTGGDDAGRIMDSGLAGDFLVVTDPPEDGKERTVSLWFCTSQGKWTKIA